MSWFMNEIQIWGLCKYFFYQKRNSKLRMHSGNTRNCKKQNESWKNCRICSCIWYIFQPDWCIHILKISLVLKSVLKVFIFSWFSSFCKKMTRMTFRCVIDVSLWYRSLRIQHTVQCYYLLQSIERHRSSNLAKGGRCLWLNPIYVNYSDNAAACQFSLLYSFSPLWTQWANFSKKPLIISRREPMGQKALIFKTKNLSLQ